MVNVVIVLGGETDPCPPNAECVAPSEQWRACSWPSSVMITASPGSRSRRRLKPRMSNATDSDATAYSRPSASAATKNHPVGPGRLLSSDRPRSSVEVSAGHVPRTASEMYSNNLGNLIEHFWDREAKTFRLDPEGDILTDCLLTHGGAIRNEKVRQLADARIAAEAGATA